MKKSDKRFYLIAIGLNLIASITWALSLGMDLAIGAETKQIVWDVIGIVLGVVLILALSTFSLGIGDRHE